MHCRDCPPVGGSDKWTCGGLLVSYEVAVTYPQLSKIALFHIFKLFFCMQLFIEDIAVLLLSKAQARSIEFHTM